MVKRKKPRAATEQDCCDFYDLAAAHAPYCVEEPCSPCDELREFRRQRGLSDGSAPWSVCKSYRERVVEDREKWFRLVGEGRHRLRGSVRIGGGLYYNLADRPGKVRATIRLTAHVGDEILLLTEEELHDERPGLLVEPVKELRRRLDALGIPCGPV